MTAIITKQNVKDGAFIGGGNGKGGDGEFDSLHVKGDTVIDGTLNIKLDDSTSASVNEKFINHESRLTTLENIHYYSLYCCSETTYRTLRKKLTLPSDSYLRRHFRRKVKRIENILTNINKIYKTFLDVSLSFKYFYCDRIESTLIVDAFSVTTLSPYNQLKYTDLIKSNCFLYLISPLEVCYPIFPIFLYQSKSSQASQFTINCIDQIIEYSKHTKFHIKYVSCDGDPGYNGRFEYFFSLIENDILNSNDDLAIKTLIQLLGVQIGDFLHFDKNFRSKILLRKIVINPTQTDDYLDYFALLSEDEISYLLRNVNSFAKLHDELATTLFCFKTIFKISGNHSNTTYIYFTLWSLWNEAILNDQLDDKTRVYFLKIVYEFLKKIYILYSQLPFHPDVKEKAQNDTDFTTFVSNKKIKKLLITILVQIYEIQENPNQIGINRVGSHTEENYIGRVRYLCDNDNRFPTVSHNIARYEYIVRHVSKCPIVFRKRHSNPGGCETKIGKAHFLAKYPPEMIANEMLSTVNLSESRSNEIWPEFINDLRQFSTDYPMKTMKIPQVLRNINIMNRFCQKDPNTEQIENKNWTEEEINLIDSSILTNKIRSLYKNLEYFKCTPDELAEKIREEQERLTTRPWTRSEDEEIILYIQKKIRLKALRRNLVCRNNDQILQRRNELKKQLEANSELQKW